MNKKQPPKNEKKQLDIKRVRVGKLNTVAEVAKLQSRLIKKGVKGGESIINDVYKLTMCLSMLAKTLEVSDLENRVEALEKKAINK
ncbi:MAG: hypothetical protein ABSA44_03640 [Bacteroidota bacterium]